MIFPVRTSVDRAAVEAEANAVLAYMAEFEGEADNPAAWEVHLWNEMGWHWSLERGAVRLWRGVGARTFSASFKAGRGVVVLSDSAEDPKEAVEKVVQKARTLYSCLGEELAPWAKPGLRRPSPPKPDGVQTVTVEIGPHPFDDAADAYEDGEPGRCAFPLCTLPPEEHEPPEAHDCEEHPELPGRCRDCGRRLDRVHGAGGEWIGSVWPCPPPPGRWMFSLGGGDIGYADSEADARRTVVAYASDATPLRWSPDSGLLLAVKP